MGSASPTDVPEYVDLQEIREACRHADPGTAALIGFLWGSGARISEALALTPQDLDVDRRMARIPTLKRRRKDGSGRKTSTSRVVMVAGHWLTPVLGHVVQLGTRPDHSSIVTTSIYLRVTVQDVGAAYDACDW
jgi:integrase